MSIAERLYIIFSVERGFRARVIARLYRWTGRPGWVPRLWARGQREWSTRMFDEQLARDGFL